ncbi:MAG: hypothetical protein LRZ99_01450 [Desulfotomaculum sp.]|nr:hypothetical protein [Desulfotomaculum sp.]
MDILNIAGTHKNLGVFIKQNQDLLVFFPVSQLEVLLDAYKFKVNFFREDDHSVTATIENFDLIINAIDENAAKKKLAEELSEYAHEYFNEFQLYYQTPNRHSQLPYVLKVLFQKNLSDIEGLINA